MAIASTTSARTAEAGPAVKEALLVVDDIVKQFVTPDGTLTAVDHVSFNVTPGEFLAVIGPSGCGKSTLFNVIGGLIDGYDGRVTVGGELVSGPHASIGMIFQEESTFPWRNVIDNVAFPLEISGVRKTERLERARHFIVDQLRGNKGSLGRSGTRILGAKTHTRGGGRRQHPRFRARRSHVVRKGKHQIGYGCSGVR